MALREDILVMLAQQAPQSVSGEAISQLLGISRAAVWKHIKALIEQGWPIVSVPRQGYRFTRQGEPLPALVQPLLNTHTLGREYQAHAQVDSTNRLARTWAAEGAPHGATVFGAQQTQGRGRRGRGWESPAGEGIYLSMILRPNMPIHTAARLTLPGALAVHRALGALGVDSAIKWPNDLLIDGRKICGILTEVSGQADALDWVVMGIGVNVLQTQFPQEIKQTAGSVLSLTGKTLLRAQLVAGILNQLEPLYQQSLTDEGFEAMLADYRHACQTLGSAVNVIEAGGQWQGTAETVDNEGALWVKDESGTLRRVLAADVSIRSQAT